MPFSSRHHVGASGDLTQTKIWVKNGVASPTPTGSTIREIVLLRYFLFSNPSIHCVISATPSLWMLTRPISGIITPGCTEFMR